MTIKGYMKRDTFAIAKMWMFKHLYLCPLGGGGGWGAYKLYLTVQNLWKTGLRLECFCYTYLIFKETPMSSSTSFLHIGN